MVGGLIIASGAILHRTGKSKVGQIKGPGLEIHAYDGSDAMAPMLARPARAVFAFSFFAMLVGLCVFFGAFASQWVLGGLLVTAAIGFVKLQGLAGAGSGLLAFASGIVFIARFFF